MFNWLNKYFWKKAARLIIKGRIFVLLLIVLSTYLLSTQWKNNNFTFSEANLLPSHHPINIEYEQFLEQFGEEGNLMVIGVADSTLFEKKNFESWNLLNQELRAMPEFETVLSTENIEVLKKNSETKNFDMRRLLEDFPKTDIGYQTFKKTLTDSFPFYEGLIYNKNKNTFRSLLFMDKEIVNTNIRKDFILNDFLPLIRKFEQETGIKVHRSGMPYIRTLNAKLMLSEIVLFIAGAILVTSLIFFLFFHSLRATLISILIVAIGVMWGFGLLGLFHYKITILTALIPPLVIVIGIPNCIFLINKYQQEVAKHGNKIRSLIRVISRVGNATLMTNLTTAAGFATFMTTDSSFLSEFGLIASLNIISLFILSILIIPSLYSFMPIPKPRHLKHLKKTWIKYILKWIENTVRHHRLKIYIVSLCMLILGIVGAFQIQLSGSILDDIPKNESFANDIKFFERNFDGVLPVEITVDTKRKKGAMRLSTLRKIDKLQELIDDTPELSKPISVVNIAKYIKQAYYNNNPKYYELPSTQENSFILSYAKKSISDIHFLENFVDSTGQIARITTMMKDMDLPQMQAVESVIKRIANKEFPKDKYDVHITGKALSFAKGTKYLVKNLFVSLLFAIGIIALMMAYLFRSFRMIIVSLIPNLLPLISTAGMMGYLGIPLKPSTILVFSVAFGISVDDTLHFLARYRQELRTHNWRIARSVYTSIHETGMSMLYTSVVLFFGFSVFSISSFGGTVALGGLVSITLLFAMCANLILLPSLLLSLEKTISNKKVLKEPIEILIEKNEDKGK